MVKAWIRFYSAGHGASRIGFDLARTTLNEILDWPIQSLDPFIRCVHRNRGRLSKPKRESQFG